MREAPFTFQQVWFRLLGQRFRDLVWEDLLILLLLLPLKRINVLVTFPPSFKRRPTLPFSCQKKAFCVGLGRSGLGHCLPPSGTSRLSVSRGLCPSVSMSLSLSAL